MFDPNRDGELLQPRTSQRSTRMDPKQKTAYVHQFQLSVQYQLSKDYSLDIGYVGNRSRNLLFSNDIGSNGLALARNSTNQFINSAILYTNGASANYDSLQIQLQKRLSRNIQGQVSYTWGHAIDNSTGIFNGLGEARNGRGGPADPANLTLDRGNSSLDVRHLLSADATPAQTRRLTASGAKAYLTKPLDIAEVLDLVDSSLGNTAPSRSTGDAT